jgi:hypothetical protein
MSSSQSSPPGRGGSRYNSMYRSGEASPFSRGEKVRMRVFQQFAKNWTVTEIGTRELGVASLHALQ